MINSKWCIHKIFYDDGDTIMTRFHNVDHQLSYGCMCMIEIVHACMYVAVFALLAECLLPILR